MTAEGEARIGEALAPMGWEALPYGCYAVARSAETSAGILWSWLVVIPWAATDSKPWIDGTKLIRDLSLSEADQRAQVIGEIREILDERYGETVGQDAVEKFLRDLQDGG